jgi:hypothetical protein
MGRGNGQVEILTRSGTNQFHGSGFWTVRNSKLDANTWNNNKNVVNGKWSPTTPPWINRNEFTGSLGGPIVKNKTFFFALFDKQFERDRQVARAATLTDCAQRGIFRYWSGWAPGNIDTQTVRGGASPTIASVDSFGNPVRPATNPDGTPYTGQLLYRSVFGPLANIPTKPDCSDAVVSGSPWDANRSQMDPSGTSQKFLSVMPHANVFNGGDGLNTAVTQWAWRGHSNADYGLASGTSFDADRMQVNTKIDQNFNAKHKVAVNYTNERLDSEYYLLGLAGSWPGNFPSQNSSILDAVSESVEDLSRGLGHADRAKLSEYLDNVREVERQIQQGEKQRTTYNVEAPETPVGIPDSFEEHVNIMFELQSLALQSYMTRVVSFMMARELSTLSYPQIGVADGHHPVSHNNGVPEQVAKKAKVDGYHLTLFANFLQKLKSTPDGDGSLLDHSLFLYGSGMSNGNQHIHTDLPIVVVGGAAGRVKGDRHIRVKDTTPLSNLMLTFLDVAGISTEKYGESSGRIDL